ncbi:MAG TPA: GGDEF domain-containing protein [Thermoanaerobaculia bacterium]|jgi:diguanylate cyclase (GGDEF)-like protein|nr:GGDEF domain-containing protein [Thermoanaerobaculia bacterium]
MDERHRSDSRDALQSRGDSDTDDIDLTPLHESGMTQTFESANRERTSGPMQVESEADVILIAHPENQRLGSRFRLSPGTTIEIGRSAAVGVSLPEVMSISRKHARLRYIGPVVTIEDLGSTNGTYVNGQPIHGRTVLRSGDRFQTAAVHFKFLHEQDVESAYHLAIYELVAKDGLTEIFNKRKLEEELQREFARAVRHQRPLSLIIFDLDEFKTINDTYGHLCGDFILKQVASLARDLVRPEQVLARVGGDEFVILAPETGVEGAQSLAAKLRDRVVGYEHRYGDIKITVSCSFGVAELARNMTAPQDLYQAADEALLLSKRGGRNRVAVHSS